MIPPRAEQNQNSRRTRRAVRQSAATAASHRRGFTLTELLTVIAIISILSTTALFALFQAEQQAKAARTRSQIAKIHELLLYRLDSYRTRPLALSIPPRTAGENALQYAQRLKLTKLVAKRELMRMELPDRITDISAGPALPGLASPSLRQGYLRRASGTWSQLHESSECLYLILATMRDGDSTALDYFRSDEVGDTDADGMPEILDGWGNPIYFLRWAPGYAMLPGPDGQWGVAGVNDDGEGPTDDAGECGFPGSDDIQLSMAQTNNSKLAPDPFDPLRVDPRWRDADQTFNPFALYPLVFSAGEDKTYDIYVADNAAFVSAATTLGGVAFASDPYTTPADSPALASPLGTPTGSRHVDNISNHLLEVRVQ